ncbi:MAG: endo alpha-1,4 polygalactosaminidase [Mycobacterium sp.]
MSASAHAGRVGGFALALGIGMFGVVEWAAPASAERGDSVVSAGGATHSLPDKSSGESIGGPSGASPVPRRALIAPPKRKPAIAHAPGGPARVADRTSGLFATVLSFFNNQTPKLSPTQTEQSSAGLVSGTLNAVDPDSELLTFTVTTQPAHGTAAVSAGGLWTYTPSPMVAATGVADSFSVTVSDAASGFAIHGLSGLIHLLSFGLLGYRGDSSTTTVDVVVAPFVAADNPPAEPPVEQQPDSDYRKSMRAFVIRIAQQARSVDPDFIVIPQNGQELITQNGEADGPLAADYLAAIDGQGREDLFYGYTADNVATPPADRDYLLDFLEREEAEGVQVLVVDYASSPARVDNSYTQNAARGFISFAANHRDLDTIPPRPVVPAGVNADDISNLTQAHNFLYLLDPGGFDSRADYLDTLAATNYDALVIDAFYDDAALTAAEVAALQSKANGGRRLVIAYMSIGEAEDYRYYWQAGWQSGSPSWLDSENPDWAGNYKVRYWEQGWQDLILSGPESYLNRITAAGFDGVYLDLIDAFEYFE